EGFPGQGPANGGSSERPRLAGRVPRWRAAAAHPRPHHGRLPRGQAPHPRLHRPRTSTSLFDHGRFSRLQFAHLDVCRVRCRVSCLVCRVVRVVTCAVRWRVGWTWNESTWWSTWTCPTMPRPTSTASAAPGASVRGLHFLFYNF